MYRQEYERWINSIYLSEPEIEELKALTDEKEIGVPLRQRSGIRHCGHARHHGAGNQHDERLHRPQGDAGAGGIHFVAGEKTGGARRRHLVRYAPQLGCVCARRGERSFLQRHQSISVFGRAPRSHAVLCRARAECRRRHHDHGEPQSQGVQRL